MTPSEISWLTAQALLTHGIAGQARFDWDDAAAWRGTHGRRIPSAAFDLPTGVRIGISSAKNAESRRKVAVTTPGGHRQDFDYGDQAIQEAWAHVQAKAIAEIIGFPLPPPPQRTWISRLPFRKRESEQRRSLRHLAETIASRIAHGRSKRSEATYLVRLTSSGLAGFFGAEPESDRIEQWKSAWHEIGNDVRILRSGATTGVGWIDHDLHMVAHPSWGVVCVPSEPIAMAYDNLRKADFSTRLDAGSRPAPAPITGNAVAARIQSICHAALESDPDLASPDGARIDTLVHEHLPNLVARHASASAAAPASHLAAIDAEFAHGLEIVRLATEQAIERGAAGSRRDLLTEIRFLELRHPDAAAHARVAP